VPTSKGREGNGIEGDKAKKGIGRGKGEREGREGRGRKKGEGGNEGKGRLASHTIFRP